MVHEHYSAVFSLLLISENQISLIIMSYNLMLLNRRQCFFFFCAQMKSLENELAKKINRREKKGFAPDNIITIIILNKNTQRTTGQTLPVNIS